MYKNPSTFSASTREANAIHHRHTPSPIPPLTVHTYSFFPFVKTTSTKLLCVVCPRLSTIHHHNSRTVMKIPTLFIRFNRQYRVNGTEYSDDDVLHTNLSVELEHSLVYKFAVPGLRVIKIVPELNVHNFPVLCH